MRILIIEDDAGIALVLRTMCERAGYDVLSAADGERGLSLLHTTQVDLVLLDVRLPGLDGISIFRRMRADCTLRRIPVIIQTALAEHEMQESLRQLCPEGLLVKPFRRQALLETIGRAIACAPANC